MWMRSSTRLDNVRPGRRGWLWFYRSIASPLPATLCECMAARITQPIAKN
jgi:hypothetical protein